MKGITKMSDEMKVCTQCGSSNSAEAKFCASCGARLETAEATQPAVEDNVYAQAIPDEAESTAPIQEEIKINYDNNEAGFSSVSYGTVQTEPRSEAEGGCIGLSIASLVCGILSLICCCLTWFSFVLTVAAIVCGIITLVKNYDGKGMAIAGIITGGLGLVIVLISLCISVALPTEEIYQEILDEFY